MVHHIISNELYAVYLNNLQVTKPTDQTTAHEQMMEWRALNPGVDYQDRLVSYMQNGATISGFNSGKQGVADYAVFNGNIQVSTATHYSVEAEIIAQKMNNGRAYGPFAIQCISEFAKSHDIVASGQYDTRDINGDKIIDYAVFNGSTQVSSAVHSLMEAATQAYRMNARTTGAPYTAERVSKFANINQEKYDNQLQKIGSMVKILEHDKDITSEELWETLKTVDLPEANPGDIMKFAVNQLTRKVRIMRKLKSPVAATKPPVTLYWKDITTECKPVITKSKSHDGYYVALVHDDRMVLILGFDKANITHTSASRENMRAGYKVERAEGATFSFKIFKKCYR